MKHVPGAHKSIVVVAMLLLILAACRQASTPLPTTALTAPGSSCIPANPPQTGKVVDVIDGDTIKVRLDQDGRTSTVRYIGIDTPESTTEVEPFGVEASAKNKELVDGKM